MPIHCCPVKRGLFCKLGLLHKGFWGVYFGGTLSAVWASGGNFLPDFIFESGRYHVRRPNPLFTGHGFCSVDEFRSHCPEVWWRRARPNAWCNETFRVIAIAQIKYRESLRDIEACLGAQPSKLCSVGLREPIAKSTLADANELRDWRIWFDLAAVYKKRWAVELFFKSIK